MFVVFQILKSYKKLKCEKLNKVNKTKDNKKTICKEKDKDKDTWYKICNETSLQILDKYNPSEILNIAKESV